MCGQACIAMIANVDIHTAILAVGHAKSTKTKEIISGLRRLGFDCQSRLRVISKGVIPNGSIVKILKPHTRNWHWVVSNNDKIYDPIGVVVNKEIYLARHKATSFLKPTPARKVQNARF